MYVIGRGLYPLMELHLNVDDWGTPPGYIYLLFKKLKSFIMSEIILDLRHTTEKKGKNIGRQIIVVNTDVRDHIITYAQWKAKGLSSNLESYKKGSFDASYFQKGDKMMNDVVCTEGDRILDQFAVAQSAKVIAYAVAAENELAEDARSAAQALFMRNRQPRVVVKDTPNDEGKNSEGPTPEELALIQQLKDAMVPQEEIDAHISGGTLAEAVAELQTAD